MNKQTKKKLPLFLKKKQEDDISENNMISKDDYVYAIASTFNNIMGKLYKIKKQIIFHNESKSSETNDDKN